MTDRYEPSTIEPKWRAQWEADKLYRRDDESDAEKYSFLTMLPYPSGDFHTGHCMLCRPRMLAHATRG